MQRLSRALCEVALLRGAPWTSICRSGASVPSSCERHLGRPALSTTASQSKLRGDCYVLRMPQMSPAMESGRVVKWHKAIGDAIEEEDLVVDVATDTLAEKGHDVGEWAGEVVMQVECHDDGYLARTFADPLDSDVKGSEPGAATGARASEALPCGVPLALICENEEDVPELSSMRGDARAVLEAVGNAVRRDATWQAFVRS